MVQVSERELVHDETDWDAPLSSLSVSLERSRIRIRLLLVLDAVY